LPYANALEIEWEFKKGTLTGKKNASVKNCDNPETYGADIIDIEGTTDKEFMENFGIDTNGIFIYNQRSLPNSAIF